MSISADPINGGSLSRADQRSCLTLFVPAPIRLSPAPAPAHGICIAHTLRVHEKKSKHNPHPEHRVQAFYINLAYWHRAKALFRQFHAKSVPLLIFYKQLENAARRRQPHLNSNRKNKSKKKGSRRSPFLIFLSNSNENDNYSQNGISSSKLSKSVASETFGASLASFTASDT